MSVTEVKRAVAKCGNPRTPVSSGAGEGLAGTRQLHACRVGGSAAWMGSLMACQIGNLSLVCVQKQEAGLTVTS